ncbi:hypothetical protein [Tenacibaculum maritimum]|uniref:hypothetical protein n=1 Tax=Tenacibaculum maritimum TaxID=107401 RepID=UPI0038771BD9
MGTYIIGLCHSSNKKKTTKSKRVNFNFENPEKDRIAQQISWSSLEISSSNFKKDEKWIPDNGQSSYKSICLELLFNRGELPSFFNRSTL